MQADRVEVSWDDHKNKWLVRIVVGEEVIRRSFDNSADTPSETLRSAAIQTASDEGYTVDAAHVAVHPKASD